MMELGGAREAREQKSKKIKLLQNYSWNSLWVLLMGYGNDWKHLGQKSTRFLGWKPRGLATPCILNTLWPLSFPRPRSQPPATKSPTRGQWSEPKITLEEAAVAPSSGNPRPLDPGGVPGGSGSAGHGPHRLWWWGPRDTQIILGTWSYFQGRSSVGLAQLLPPLGAASPPAGWEVATAAGAGLEVMASLGHRYNSHTIKFTSLAVYNLMPLRIFTELYNHHHNWFWTLYSPQKETW